MIHKSILRGCLQWHTKSICIFNAVRISLNLSLGRFSLVLQCPNCHAIYLEYNCRILAVYNHQILGKISHNESTYILCYMLRNISNYIYLLNIHIRAVHDKLIINHPIEKEPSLRQKKVQRS